MSQKALLELMISYPDYWRLMPHLSLLIVSGSHGLDLFENNKSKFFDEDFFEQLAWQVGRESRELADSLRKKIKLYGLERGDWGSHQELFKSTLLALPESQADRSELLEGLLESLENSCAYQSARACPKELIQVIKAISKEFAGHSFYDPYCSTGKLLTELVMSKPNSFGLGQADSDEDILFGGLRAYFKDGRLSFKKVNALNSRPIGHNDLQVFDVVVSDLSGSLEKISVELDRADHFGRFKYGIPPKGREEWAFIQHMLAHMHPHRGITVAVIDRAALLRSGKEAEIREAIILAGQLDSLIYLPSKLYRSDARALALLVFKSNRQAPGVLVINGSLDYSSEKSLNTLTPTAVEQIPDYYYRRESVEGKAVLVSIDELKSCGFSLNLERFFPATPVKVTLDLRELGTAHNALLESMRAVSVEINDLISEISELP